MTASMFSSLTMVFSSSNTSARSAGFCLPAFCRGASQLYVKCAYRIHLTFDRKDPLQKELRILLQCKNVTSIEEIERTPFHFRFVICSTAFVYNSICVSYLFAESEPRLQIRSGISLYPICFIVQQIETVRRFVEAVNNPCTSSGSPRFGILVPRRKRHTERHFPVNPQRPEKVFPDFSSEN